MKDVKLNNKRKKALLYLTIAIIIYSIILVIYLIKIHEISYLFFIEMPLIIMIILTGYGYLKNSFNYPLIGTSIPLIIHIILIIYAINDKQDVSSVLNTPFSLILISNFILLLIELFIDGNTK